MHPTEPVVQGERDDFTVTAPDDFFEELFSSGNESESESDKTEGEGFIWDKSQKEVFLSSKDARLLVNAGPGTGKTAVACKRVANLIDKQGCNPNKIWIISFTRSAVAEIRDRIASYLTDRYKAYSVKIATLDSHAWAINSGFDEDATLDGSFESNISRVIDLVRNDGDVFQELKSCEHMIVDEAQDFIGIRATLVIEIINKIPDNVGVTVFADEAQAIYGFSVEKCRSDGPDFKLTLPKRIRKAKIFDEVELTSIHRTSSEGLKSIFKDTRIDVLDDTCHPPLKYHGICDQIRKKADFNGEKEFDPLRVSMEDSSFVLFRSKREALKASTTMGSRPHRIRMGNVSTGIVPWIGALLGGIQENRLKNQDFKTLWKERGIEKIAHGFDPASAWDSLRKLSGGTRRPRVDIDKLRQNLLKQNIPPVLLLPELGVTGPILGTIHAAKGREAKDVYLCIPPNEGGRNADYDEETRVVFVGATRAKRFLHVYKGYKATFERPDEQRVWEKAGWTPPAAHVQIGCPGDIDFHCLAGRELYNTTEDVASVQDTLRTLAESIEESGPVSLTALRSNSNIYDLVSEEGQIISKTSKNVNKSLYRIGKIINRNSSVVSIPYKLKGIKIMDLCTLVTGDDSSLVDSLHVPWGENGIILAPRIIGYPMVYFK